MVLATVVSAIVTPTQTWSFLQVIFLSLYLNIFYARKMTINATLFGIKLYELAGIRPCISLVLVACFRLPPVGVGSITKHILFL